MSFDVDDGGIKQMKLRLQRLRGVKGVANEELKACANDVAQKAKDMAPIDYGDLKRAIQVGRRGVQGAGGRFVKGVSNYDVFISGNTKVQDPKKLDRKDPVETVGEYVWEVHEHMGWASQPGKFMPSEESVQAGLEKGVEAGGKFMERAQEAMRQEVVKRMITVTAAYIQKTLDN
jgi:hypothetical protein